MPTPPPHLRAAAALAALLSPAAATASTLTTVHTFAGNPDGATPAYAMLAAGGVLYGTTQYGGTSNNGTLFKFDPATNTETVLYNFAGGADAALPQSPLVLYQGALYGLSYFGGAANIGTVLKFDLATNTESVVHAFSGNEGSYPRGAVVIRGDILYGTASYGGRTRNGTLFRVNLTTGAAKVLHQFATAPDGASPEGGLTYDAGTIFGTTLSGGANNAGTIFQLDPHTGAYQRVYSFDATHGGYSSAALTLHAGLLYGTGACGPQGIGCIFSYDPATFTETPLYNFSGMPDGEGAYAGVLYHSGALYGVTQQGGATDEGTVYKLDLATNTETILYSFTGGADGNNPAAKLVYTAHNFYGSTVNGGTASMGTLFKIP